MDQHESLLDNRDQFLRRDDTGDPIGSQYEAVARFYEHLGSIDISQGVRRPDGSSNARVYKSTRTTRQRWGSLRPDEQDRTITNSDDIEPVVQEQSRRDGREKKMSHASLVTVLVDGLQHGKHIVWPQ